MKAKNPVADIEFDCIGQIPALNAAETDDILGLALALSGDTVLGKVAYGTEASFFQQIGIPSVVCGPGSIDQAHKPDEYVALDQLAKCETFVDRLVERLSA
jgi:acetylornithine deacetylase